MESRYLIDTNTAIDYLHNRLSDRSNLLIDSSKINMSVITRMELLSWKHATPQQLNLLANFIMASNVYNLDENTIVEGINIRRNYKIKLPDAIIAATSLVNNFVLVTRNTIDFKAIPTLELINPWSKSPIREADLLHTYPSIKSRITTEDSTAPKVAGK